MMHGIQYNNKKTPTTHSDRCDHVVDIYFHGSTILLTHLLGSAPTNQILLASTFTLLKDNETDPSATLAGDDLWTRGIADLSPNFFSSTQPCVHLRRRGRNVLLSTVFIKKKCFVVN
jgi:hypothetical protein